MRKIITSESVNIGHPDKTCDTIADAFLDEALKQDRNAQMAVECAIKNNKLFIYGEATTSAQIDYQDIASRVLKDVGYDMPFEFVVEVSIFAQMTKALCLATPQTRQKSACPCQSWWHTNL